MTDLFKSFADAIKERLEKAKVEEHYSPKGKRSIREDRRVEVASAKPQPIENRLAEYKEGQVNKDEGFADQIKINADKKAKQDAERSAKTQDLADKTKRGSRGYNDRQLDKPIPKKPVDRKGLSVVKGDLIKALMDSGFTQSARDLSIWDHKDNNACAMEKSLLKSNYGPKGMGLYNAGDNQKRKENNTGEALENVGQNKNLKQYTTTASSVQAASEKNTAKEQRKKTKASTKTMKDFTPEEQQAITDRANKPK